MCSLLPSFFNNIIDWILGQALQDYPGVQVGANIHVSDLAYAENILILSSSYSEKQGLFEAVNRHAAAVSMRINASKTKVMSALISGEQRQAVLPQLDVRRKRPGHRGDQKQDSSCSFRILSPATLSLVAA